MALKKIEKKSKKVTAKSDVPKARSGRLLPTIQIALYEPVPKLTRVKKYAEGKGLKLSNLGKDLLFQWYETEKAKDEKRAAKKK